MTPNYTNIVWNASKEGNFDIVKKYHKFARNSINYIFQSSCRYGHQEIVSFFIDNYTLDINEGYIQSCMGFHLQLLKYIESRKNITSDIITRGIYACCSIKSVCEFKKQITIFKYLISRIKELTTTQHLSNILITCMYLSLDKLNNPMMNYLVNLLHNEDLDEVIKKYFSIQEYRKEIYSFLVNKGANLELIQDNENLIYQYYIRHKNFFLKNIKPFIEYTNN